MRESRNGFLIVVCDGLLLSWVSAWASFIMPMAGHRPFPLPDGALILALATMTTLLHQGRGWRIISIIALQAVGFLLAALRMVYVHFEWSRPFWSKEWVVTMLSQQRNPLEWMIALLVLFWAIVLWVGGTKIVRTPTDLFTIGSRFDLGAAAFLILLLVELIMLGKGVPLHHDRNSESSFLAFLVLGLLGLGIARYGNSGERGPIAAYRGMGVILSFVIFVLLLGGGLVILFLPALRSAAEWGHGLLKAGAGPVLPVLVTMLRFVLVKGCRSAREGPRSAKPGDAVPDLSLENGSGGGVLEAIVVWGFAALAGLLVLAILALAAWYLIRWLASRSPERKNPLGMWEIFRRWVSLVKTLLLSFLTRAPRRKDGKREAGYHYALLLRWGSRCGLPHLPNETPLEYGSRLLRHFPMLSKDIPLIIDLFNQTVYGVTDPGMKQLAPVRLAMRRLKSPLIWPARVKTWFFSPGV
jgi:hypothetical protein